MASKTTGSLQMSMGVTGPWVGGRGLSVGTPVFKEFTNAFHHTQSKSIHHSRPRRKIFSFHYCKSDTSSNRRAPGCLGCHHWKVWSPWWKCKWVPLMLQGPGSAPSQGRDQTHGLPPGTNCSLEDTTRWRDSKYCYLHHHGCSRKCSFWDLFLVNLCFRQHQGHLTLPEW